MTPPSYSAPHGEPELAVDINTTPLIDVMLVLLIMLIITIPIQTAAVRLDMAANAPPPDLKPAVIDVDVGEDGAVNWNGHPLAGPAEIEDRMHQAASAAEALEIHVRAADHAPYGRVAAILASARRQGLARIGIVGTERFIKD